MLSLTLNSNSTERKSWRQINGDKNISFIPDEICTKGSDVDVWPRNTF